MPFISPHTSHQKIPAILLNTLQHHYSLILILSLSISRKCTYLTAPTSKYLNTSPCSSLTKSFLLESNLYNFSSSYNLIFFLSLTFTSLTLPYIVHITNITSYKTSISFTISMLLKRYQTLIPKTLLMEGIKLLMLKPFSQNAPRSYIKALLMEGTNLSYIKPFSQKAQVLHTKALLMESNTIHNFTTTKKALSTHLST